MGMSAVTRRADFPVRALGVLAGAALLHFVAATLLLAHIGGEPLPGQRATLHLVVLLTACVGVGVLYVRTQYSTTQHAARSIPWVFWLVPPLLLAGLLPLVLPTALLQAGPLPVVRVSLPLVASTWCSAMLAGLVCGRVLRAMAARTTAEDVTFTLRSFDPPALARSYGRAMIVLTTASTLLAIAIAAPHVEHGTPLAEAVAAGLALVFLLALAALVGSSLGQSPGEDIVSIGERLDTLGYGSPDALASPVVVTSLDEVGGLFARLEQLRARLAEEMKLYQEALDRTRAADALKSDFLSAVSHELRTPLNVIGGFAQLLLEGVPHPLTEAQAEDVRLIRAGGRQLLELINDILDMSMIESGELRLSYSATDVAVVIHEVLRIHAPLVRDKLLVLHAEIGPDLPAVVCDRRRLTQILTNLVSNAVKFTEQGSITVRAAFDPRMDGVVIRCIDTGVGIEAKDLAHIFEEYRQVGSLKRRKKGTGLGLAIARRIAHAHGGSLAVESAPGEGSTFTLSLPLDPPNRPEAIDMAEEAARSRAKRRETRP